MDITLNVDCILRNSAGIQIGPEIECQAVVRWEDDGFSLVYLLERGIEEDVVITPPWDRNNEQTLEEAAIWQRVQHDFTHDNELQARAYHAYTEARPAA